jgi:uncharacterized protein DUF6644
MPEILTFCQWLERTSVGSGVRESLWLFPAIETVHLFGIILLVGSTVAFDLRLLGWGLREQAVSKVASRLLPWAWVGFAVQVLTGTLLFASEATKCYGNPAFRIKMLLLLVAGGNAWVFHVASFRKMGAWDNTAATPGAAKFAGVLSILLWFGIVAAGRWIGFT